jgi:predicted Zn-dependent peptidase
MVVLLKEQRTAPLISWWVLYRIGSRNEPTGKTGISHWVEHMMFKGTDQFPPGYLDKAVDREGGVLISRPSRQIASISACVPKRIGWSTQSLTRKK